MSVVLAPSSLRSSISSLVIFPCNSVRFRNTNLRNSSSFSRQVSNTSKEALRAVSSMLTAMRMRLVSCTSRALATCVSSKLSRSARHSTTVMCSCSTAALPSTNGMVRRPAARRRRRPLTSPVPSRMMSAVARLRSLPSRMAASPRHSGLRLVARVLLRVLLRVALMRMPRTRSSPPSFTR
eukprot:Rmarinus@m.19554